MKEIICDLHLHSCLSPCGDNRMTPATVAGYSKLRGVDVAALTDHNTTGNCPAFFKACKYYGISPLAGMELTTAEDIHLICLFKTLKESKEFEKRVYKKRILIPNKPEIFGRQLLMDEEDNIIGEEKHLLLNGTKLTISEAYELCNNLGGLCYPAHVDRTSNGIIGVLGTFPNKPPFGVAEFKDPTKIPEYCKQYENLKTLKYVYGSDAHFPEMLQEKAEFSLQINCEEDLAAEVFKYLKE